MLSTLQFVLLHNSGLNKLRNQHPVLPLFGASSPAYSLSTLLCLVKLGKPGWKAEPHLPDPEVPVTESPKVVSESTRKWKENPRVPAYLPPGLTA